jgi:hypothetical protein
MAGCNYVRSPDVVKLIKAAQRKYEKSREREILQSIRTAKRLLVTPHITRGPRKYLARQLNVKPWKVGFFLYHHARDLKLGQGRYTVVDNELIDSLVNRGLVNYLARA